MIWIMLLIGQILIGLLLLLLLLWAAFGWATLWFLRRGPGELDPLEPDSFEEAVFKEAARWTESHDFARAGIYRADRRTIAYWQDEKGRTLCVAALPNGLASYFSTSFDVQGTQFLTTTNAITNPILPPAMGQWIQWFPQIELKALWQEHHEAEELLAATHGLRPFADPRPHSAQLAAGADRLRAQARALSLFHMLRWWSRARVTVGQPLASQLGLAEPESGVN